MLHKTPKRLKPTDGELEILSVLWEKGPLTVREMHELLETKREMGRTTVLKLVQIMTEKGLVWRDESVRPHRFSAGPTREATQTNLVEDLLSKAFGGSSERLVMHVLDGAKTSPEELKAIREMIKRLEDQR